MILVNFEHVFKRFSSVAFNDSELEMFAGLRLLDYESDTFFPCILFSLYILLCFYVIISSKIFFVPVEKFYSLLTRITISFV